MKQISPQEGPQTEFLRCSADIAIYGGAAGGGKTFGLLLDPLYEYNNPRFSGVTFRKNTTQIRNPGGLWDESMEVYFPLGGKPKESVLEWTFPSGMTMKFAHLENEKTVYDWQGSQLPWIGFDELVHFSAKQFWYMLSRNRSMAGVPGRVRATCNPDADSWVRNLIDWWIGSTGDPIPERSGVLRWFIRDGDEMVWADSREELIEMYGADQTPKSLTFIAANVFDNKILMNADPAYLSNLRALPRIERLRLLGGNWNVRPSAGMFFQREWFPTVDAVPAGWTRAVRYWDRAATRPNETNTDPDYTVGLLMYAYPNGTSIVVDVRRSRESPLRVEQFVKNTAAYDGVGIEVVGEQEPGAAGVADANAFTRLLNGYIVRIEKPTKDKATRAKPVSAQCEAGNVFVLRAPWNGAFFQELENFSGEDDVHDDQVDTLSGAYNVLHGVAAGILDVV